jgi:hypothetical protein
MKDVENFLKRHEICPMCGLPFPVIKRAKQVFQESPDYFSTL